jgi:hypothetical protein
MEVLGTALDEVFSSRAGAGVTAQRGRLGQGTEQTCRYCRVARYRRWVVLDAELTALHMRDWDRGLHRLDLELAYLVPL